MTTAANTATASPNDRNPEMTTTTPETTGQNEPESTIDMNMIVHTLIAMAVMSVLIAAAVFIITPIAQAAHAVHGG